MAKSALLAPEHQTYASERYLANVPPRELAEELDGKFGVKVTPAQLRQWLTRSGLGKRRKDLDAKTCAIVSSAKIDALAKARAEEPRRQLENWATQTVVAADRAFDMASAATKPRDLASAVSAASTSVRLYQNLRGVEAPPQRVVFDYRFAAQKLPAHRRRVEVTVTPELSQSGDQVSGD